MYKSALLILFMAFNLMAQAEAVEAGSGKITSASQDTILVLDASGSMWGQIDGVNKIVIAKDVVEELVLNLPPSRQLGLVAYGHRRKADCSDIEVLSAVGADRAELIEQVRALNPKGKTPLSASVLHAAEQMDYTKHASSVIVVSDGRETCDMDPCELGRVLEANGLDFSVHVIGFNVTVEERRGLQCLADETGGQFFTADNAQQLSKALDAAIEVDSVDTVEPGGATQSAKVVLKATILTDGPQIQKDLRWQVASDNGEIVFEADAVGVVEAQLVAGDYVVIAHWSGWSTGEVKQGVLPITIEPNKIQVFTVPVELELPVELIADSVVQEGNALQVSWSGPDELGAIVGVFERDAAPVDRIFFVSATRGNKAAGDFMESSLAMPPVAGEYELRYVLNKPSVVLARQPIEVEAADYLLQAPSESAVSSIVEIVWQGPNTKGDMITIVPAGDSRAFDNARYTALTAGEPAILTAPKLPGEYEIRYVMYSDYTTYAGMSRAVKKTLPLTITEVTATVSGPDTAVGGSTIDVNWVGPAGYSDDYIAINEPGKDGFNRNAWVSLVARGTQQPIQPVSIRAPAVEGKYEIVYVLMPGRRVITRQPIDISRAVATITAPLAVKAGESITVSYTGDGFKGDRIVLVSAEYSDTKMWGVGVNNGFSTEAATDGEIGTGVVTSRVTTVAPGNYELRYVTGLQHQVLARAAITVTQ